MDKGQTKVLQQEGVWDFMPNGNRQAKMTYYRVLNGEIVECPNLPADPIFLRRYLNKGFRLSREELMSQAVEKSQEGFVCEVCGKVLKTKLALSGHNRSHK